MDTDRPIADMKPISAEERLFEYIYNGIRGEIRPLVKPEKKLNNQKILKGDIILNTRFIHYDEKPPTDHHMNPT